MTEQLPNTIIRHKGTMDYPLVIKTIRTWYDDEDYIVDEPTHKAKKSSDGSEYEIDFITKRRINEYIQYYLNVQVKAWEVKEIEIIKDGKKTKTWTGRINIDIMPSYDLDWQKRFGNNKFLQALQQFFHKYIIYRDINDKWEDDLMFKVVQLARTIREVLGHD